MFENMMFDETTPRTLSTRTFDQFEDLYIVNLIAGNIKGMSDLLDSGYVPTSDQATAMHFAGSVALGLLPKLAMKNPIAVEMMGNLDDLLKNLK